MLTDSVGVRVTTGLCVWLWPHVCGLPRCPSDIMWAIPKGILEASRGLATQSLQERYIQRHLMRRTLLANTLGVSPQSLELCANSLGKPTILRGGYHFNASHSGELHALAGTADGEVGIDIEKVQRFREMVSVYEYAFHKTESAWLNNMSEQDRLKCFYRLWTMKEAVVKCIGSGLSEPDILADVTFLCDGNGLYRCNLTGVYVRCLEHSDSVIAVAAPRPAMLRRRNVKVLALMESDVRRLLRNWRERSRELD